MIDLSRYITITISSNRNDATYFTSISKNLELINCRKILVHGANQSLDSVPNLWEYYHTPSLNHYQRHYKSINMVDTPYVLEAAEDDVYSLEFIQQAINFLNTNKNYISCRGLVLGCVKNKIDYGCYLTKSQLSVFQKQLKDDFYSDNPIERLKYFMNSKNLLNPSRNIKRVTHWRDFLKFLTNYPEYWPISYIDRIEMIYESLAGNIKTINNIQLLKSQGNRTTIEDDLSKNNKGFNHIKNHLDNMVQNLSKKFLISPILLETELRNIEYKSSPLVKNSKQVLNNLNLLKKTNTLLTNKI